MKFLPKVIIEAIITETDVLQPMIDGLDKITNKLEERAKKKARRIFECAPGEKVLLINQQKYTWREHFYVFDSYNNVKFTVKGEFTSIKHRLHIYNDKGKEVGFVKEKLFTFHPSAVLECKPVKPVEIEFSINGEKVGKLSSTYSLGIKYVLDNGWNLEGKIFSWNYQIVAPDRVVAKISEKLLAWGDTYVITYPEDENELMILMIALALDIIKSPSRKEELKDTIHNMRYHYK